MKNNQANMFVYADGRIEVYALVKPLPSSWRVPKMVEPSTGYTTRHNEPRDRSIEYTQFSVRSIFGQGGARWHYYAEYSLSNNEAIDILLDPMRIVSENEAKA